jgi:hypothetical protein
VIFSSLTTEVCTASGAIVNMVAAGVCSIAANQAGDANYTPAAQVTQEITINGIPQNIFFIVPPTLNVGETFTLTASGGLSGNPVTFTSLTPTVCSNVENRFTALAGGGCIIAANQAGNALYAPAPQFTQSIGIRGVTGLNSVVSRKQHAGIDREIVIDHTLPITGNIGTEPRAIGPGHQIVFQFNGAVTQPGFAGAVDSALFDIGTATANVNPLANNEVIVTLSGIPENKRVTVSLLNVNGIATPFSASLGFLVGDVNGNLSVNSSDISGVKARSGQVTDASNFRFDVNANGTINSSDISAVKARSGSTLAP